MSAQLVYNLEAIARPQSDGISSTLELRSQENGYGCMEELSVVQIKLTNFEGFWFDQIQREYA